MAVAAIMLLNIYQTWQHKCEDKTPAGTGCGMVGRWARDRGGVDTVMHKRLYIYLDLLFAKIKGNKRNRTVRFSYWP